MENVLEFAGNLVLENPAITPEEMFRQPHLSGYGTDRAIYAVFSLLRQPLDQLCRMAIVKCRLWKKAVCYSSKEQWAATDCLTPGLIAMWGFWNQAGKDCSPIGNDLDVSGYSFEPWSL